MRLIMFDRAEVSPGLRSRPSLSGHRLFPLRLHGRVSPGLRSRPSLSDAPARRSPQQPAGVAGITVPAFVERVTKSAMRMSGRSGVAGITVPAFVERGARALTKSLLTRCVAGITVPAFVERCSAPPSVDTAAAGVAGITVPAFVERQRVSVGPMAHQAGCRRDYGPGLR